MQTIYSFSRVLAVLFPAPLETDIVCTERVVMSVCSNDKFDLLDAGSKHTHREMTDIRVNIAFKY